MQPSPVAPAQIGQCVPSPSSSLCARFTAALLTLPSLLYQWWTWAFDAQGNATNAFKETVNYIQPGDLLWSASPLVPTPSGPGSRLPCDGSTYSSTQYPDLFTAIGNAYTATPGQSDGQGGYLFQVPNAAGRSLAAIGTSTDGNGVTTTISAGQNAAIGEAAHSLTSAEMPPHTHTYTMPDDSTSGSAISGGGGGTSSRSTGTTGGTGSPAVVSAHNNWHPIFGMYLYIQS